MRRAAILAAVFAAALACPAVAQDAPASAATYSAGRFLADIYALARIRLAACGVTAIYGGGLCTVRYFQRYRPPVLQGAFTGSAAELLFHVYLPADHFYFYQQIFIPLPAQPEA